VSLSRDGVPLEGRGTQRRRLAVLAVLAAARDHGVSRDRLLGYLWPDLDSERGRQALSQALSALRHDLGEEVFQAGIDDLRLNPAVLRTDVGEFARAVTAGDWEVAAAAYAGPFLDGFFLADTPEFEAWVDGERRRLAEMYATALESLARKAATDGDREAAVAWWRKRAAHTPLDSGVALRLMEALVGAGDRGGAIQHARIHSALLQADLELGADPAIAAYVERLRRESSAVPAGRPPAALPVATSRLEDAPVVVSERPRRRTRLPVLLATAAALVVVVSLVLRNAGGLPPSRSVVLGTLQGPDADLSRAVREALLTELEGTPSIRVLGDAQVRETLRLMGLADSTPISGLVALEIAQRRGVSLTVEGSVMPVGNGTLVVAKVIDVRSGAPIASLSERPATAAAIIPAIERLATGIRGRVARAVVDSAPAMPFLTTSSLPALRNYVFARQALARLDREAGIAQLEGALVHDSLFALAHYLLGDMLWYLDRQRESEGHLARALALSDRLPPRERLIVRARYEQVVMDRQDSSLAYWRRAQAAHPEDALGYEGSTWTLRAMARFAEAAAAADTALRLDPASGAPMYWARLLGLLGAGDTARAFVLARTDPIPPGEAEVTVRSWAAFLRRDWEGLLTIYDAEDPPSSLGVPSPATAYRRQVPVLALGRLAEGARLLAVVQREGSGQRTVRALILQALAEAELGGSKQRSAEYARQALDLLDQADFSPPTNARLTERIADVARRVEDAPTLARSRRFLLARDRGRDLPSYRLALRSIDAATAYVGGDRRAAARLAEAAREGTFFVRSVVTVALLEADARLSLGEVAGADSLYRSVLTPRAFADGDLEAMAVLQTIALRSLESRTPTRY
jgi:DNA-binding SARP family transcriptional activator/tetratricopeptide (TPR) repeat protein